eukprot:16434857-Heterocapsa_arctica.AAC.1
MPRDALIWEQCPHCGPEGHDFAGDRIAVSPKVRCGHGARLAQDVVHGAPRGSRIWPPRGGQAALLKQRT